MLEAIDKLPTWSIAGSYTLFWLLVSAGIYFALHGSLAAVVTAKPTKLGQILSTSVPRFVAIALFLVAMASGMRLLRLSGTNANELRKLLSLAIAIVGVGVLVRIVLRAIDAFGRANPELRSSAGIGRAFTWAAGLGVVAVLVSDALGISLAPALTALGVGSLSVALALQDTLSNFFAGVYIVFDKPVRMGDFIRVDPSYDGYVETIGWRSTHLRTTSNNLVIIPNATLSKAVITNFTLPTPNVATNVRVDLDADADVAKIEDALADEARRALDVPGIAQAPAPTVVFAPGFVDGALAFTIYFHVTSVEAQGPVQHVLRKRVAMRMKKEGIALANAAGLPARRVE